MPLDTSSPLPLLNSLTHLTYLTSTSPRIREIMTMDGGLERLVRILHDFCLSPPSPENASLLYGLMPPSIRPPKPAPTLNPTSFDKQAAYRFSLAFQCVVNIGVRGSEPIRSRVVQAGTLEVVGCILEAWLANKGFAVGPSSSATGMPRETREQRQARRDAVQRQREMQLLQHVQEQEEIDRQRNRQPVAPQRGPRPSILNLPDERPTTRRPHREADAGPSTFAMSTDDRQITLRQQHERNLRPIDTSRDMRPHPIHVPGQFVIDEDEAMEISANADTDNTIHEALLLLSASVPSVPTASNASHSNFASTSTSRSVSIPPSSSSTSRHHSAEREREPGSDTDLSTDASAAPTPVGSGTPTGSVIFPSRDRSGTIIARPVWDFERARERERERDRQRERGGDTTEEEAEDVDMDREVDNRGRRTTVTQMQVQVQGQGEHRRAVGIVSDEAQPSADTHIIISESDSGVGVGVAEGLGAVSASVGMGGVEDGIVSMEANDDFAMGAPPGAPGAMGLGVVTSEDEREGEGETETEAENVMEGVESTTSSTSGSTTGSSTPALATGMIRTASFGPDETPRPGVVGLPSETPPAITHQHNRSIQATLQEMQSPQITPGRPMTAGTVNGTGERTGQGRHHHHHHHHVHHHHPPTTAGATAAAQPTPSSTSHSHSHTTQETSPYRDEDVLLSLQLLAYLSKYPHVRQAFYKPRTTFHPASIDVVGGRWAQAQRGKEKAIEVKEEIVRGKEKEKEGGGAAGFLRALRGKASAVIEPKEEPTVSTSPAASNAKPRQTNVFSLVERFTFKPSSTETELLGTPTPRLPAEIQYWAGVVMRNACRKDESRGGIRQCANMLCGRWEAYPREFAKCRRCRKAKYCGKECQSTAWSEGHRFWCSAKDDDEAPANSAGTSSSTATSNGASAGDGDARRERRERERRERERERERERGGTIRGEPVYPGGTVGRLANAPVNHAHPSSTTRVGANAPIRPPQDPIGTPARGGGVAGRAYIPPQYDVPIYGEPPIGTGRRRAETVTGASMVGGAVTTGGPGGGPSMVHHLYGPGYHPRHAHGHGRVGGGAQRERTRANPLMQFAQQALEVGGDQTGPREGEDEDNSMVLG
ncbi:hypothetical protein H0H93_010741 [Arthromyces matolae]|nr:hypothetical protein H0H93_010741 [Arthromyces matolae]